MCGEGVLCVRGWGVGRGGVLADATWVGDAGLCGAGGLSGFNLSVAQIIRANDNLFSPVLAVASP